MVSAAQRVSTLALVSWLLASAWLSCLTGCSSSSEEPAGEKPKFEVADDEAGGGSAGTTDATAAGSAAAGATEAEGGSATGAPVQPPPISMNSLEAIEVPDGTPDELLEFASQQRDKLMEIQAQLGGRLDESAKVRLAEVFRAILTASDKLLGLPDATAEQRYAAVEQKAFAMGWLSQLEPESDWSAKTRHFATQLVADADSGMQIRGKEILMGLQVGEFIWGRNQDVEGLIRQLADLLKEDPRGIVVLGLANRLVNSLDERGFRTESRQVLDMIVAAYQDSTDPILAGEANNLIEVLLYRDADIEAKFSAVMDRRPGAGEVFLTELDKIFAQGVVGGQTLQRTAYYIGLLQQTGQYDVARQLCERIEQAFANHSNEQWKQDAAGLTQAALRRLDLIGQPLVVTAERLDGTALDLSPYQQKVVLVVFFTPADPNSQRELAAIKTAYEQFHAKGFEVIGVAVRSNPDTLDQYLAQANLPWLTVKNDEFSQQCGADLLPFGVLLDRQGLVTEIFVQGPSLPARLAKILGPADQTPPAGTPPAANPPATGPTGPTGGQSQWRPARRHGALAGFVLAGLPQPVDDPPPSQPASSSGAAASQEDEGESALDEVDEAINPYLAPSELSVTKLVFFLFDMQEKSTSIRRRPGFADAVVDAADRILQGESDNKQQLIAIQAKLDILHENACLGDERSDAQLALCVDALGQDPRPAVAEQVKFFQLERRVLEADQLELDAIAGLLQEVQTYVKAQDQLGQRHLRLASATVHAINRIEDGAAREKHFQEFGDLFADSADAQLARYGKKLAKGGQNRASDLVGKPLELAGTTDLGVPLDWASYRGKVVLVDFWATWCGPCLREMPQVKALYEELDRQAFEIVAVSLDEDLEALAKYLQEHQLPWTNLVGEEARNVASKYAVTGIPTMMLVDREGKVVAVDHHVQSLRPRIKELLESGATAK